MNRHRRLAMAILPLVVMTAGACSRADTRKDTPPPASDWDTFRDGFMNTEFDLFPDLAVYVGRHEFDVRNAGIEIGLRAKFRANPDNPIRINARGRHRSSRS